MSYGSVSPLSRGPGRPAGAPAGGAALDQIAIATVAATLVAVSAARRRRPPPRQAHAAAALVRDERDAHHRPARLGRVPRRRGDRRPGHRGHRDVLGHRPAHRGRPRRGPAGQPGLLRHPRRALRDLLRRLPGDGHARRQAGAGLGADNHAPLGGVLICACRRLLAGRLSLSTTSRRSSSRPPSSACRGSWRSRATRRRRRRRRRDGRTGGRVGLEPRGDAGAVTGRAAARGGRVRPPGGGRRRCRVALSASVADGAAPSRSPRRWRTGRGRSAGEGGGRAQTPCGDVLGSGAQRRVRPPAAHRERRKAGGGAQRRVRPPAAHRERRKAGGGAQRPVRADAAHRERRKAGGGAQRCLQPTAAHRHRGFHEIRALRPDRPTAAHRSRGVPGRDRPDPPPSSRTDRAPPATRLELSAAAATAPRARLSRTPRARPRRRRAARRPSSRWPARRRGRRRGWPPRRAR